MKTTQNHDRIVKYISHKIIISLISKMPKMNKEGIEKILQRQ